MSHVFVATATRTTETGSYEDRETEVETTVVAVRNNSDAAQDDLADWVKKQHTDDRTQLHLTITEADPITGTVLATSHFRTVPSIELMALDA